MKEVVCSTQLTVNGCCYELQTTGAGSELFSRFFI